MRPGIKQSNIILSVILCITIIISTIGYSYPFSATADDGDIDATQTFFNELKSRADTSNYVKAIREANYLNPDINKDIVNKVSNGVENDPDNYNFRGFLTIRMKGNQNFQKFIQLKLYLEDNNIKLDYTNAKVPPNSRDEEWNTRLNELRDSIINYDLSGAPTLEKAQQAKELADLLPAQLTKTVELIQRLIINDEIKITYKGEDYFTKGFDLLWQDTFERMDVCMQKLIDDILSIFICPDYETFNNAYENIFNYDKGENIKLLSIVFGVSETIGLINNLPDITNELNEYINNNKESIKNKLLTKSDIIFGDSPKESAIGIDSIIYDIISDVFYSNTSSKLYTTLAPILKNTGLGLVDESNWEVNDIVLSRLHNTILYSLKRLDPEYEARWIYLNTLLGIYGTLAIPNGISGIPVTATKNSPYDIKDTDLKNSITKLSFYSSLQDVFGVSQDVSIPLNPYVNYLFYDNNNTLITTASTNGNKGGAAGNVIDLEQLKGRTGKIKIIVERIHKTQQNIARDFVQEFWINIKSSSTEETTPPATTTEPTKATTEPPKTTTDPPQTTTEPPQTTTEPPKTTTEPPPETTPPVQTTKPPSGGGGGGSSSSKTPSPSPTATATPTVSPTQTPEPTQTPMPTSTPSPSYNHVLYIKGYSDGTVKPDAHVNRAELAVMMYRLLSDEDKSQTDNNNPYTDVEENTWYTEAILTLSKKGVLHGYEGNTFKPEQPVTRAEFTTMAVRINNADASSTRTFPDVPNSHWALRFIETATELGWILGFEDGTFRPDEKLSRGQVAAIINRYANRRPDLFPENIHTYTDLRPEHWAYKDIIEASHDHKYSLNADGTEQWKTIE